MTLEDRTHAGIIDQSTEMDKDGVAVRTTEMDLSASMVYIRDIERDAGSSSSTCRVHSTGSRPGQPDNACSKPTANTPFFRQSLPSCSLFLPLLLTTLQTGLLDASTFASYGVFASNQTGNAILLTLAAANAAPVELHNTAASLGGFLLSGFVAGRIGNWLGTRNRLWLAISNGIQMVLLLIVTILSSPGVSVLQPSDRKTQWITLLLLASSSGLQVAMAKTSGVQEVPTAMLTSPFIELLTDKNLFVRWNAKDNMGRARNRRVIYMLCLMGGSLVGAYMHRYTHGPTSVLILATCLKAITTVQMGLLPGEDA